MVQSFPQPTTSTMTMLQARSPSSEVFQPRAQGQQHQHNQPIPRNIYNTPVGGTAAGSYRGQTSNPPVTPYGFQTTPIPQNGPNPLRQHPTAPPNPRLESRTASAPSVPLTLQASQQIHSSATRPRPPPVNTTPPSNIFLSQQQAPTDDPAALSGFNPKQLNSSPLPTLDLNPPSLPSLSYATVAKSSPDRYRRNHRRAETSGVPTSGVSSPAGSALPSGSGMATVGHLYNHPMQTSSTPALSTYRGTQAPSSPIKSDFSAGPQPRLASKDDSSLQRERQSTSDLAKRYRRRSISSLEAKDFVLSEAPAQQSAQPKTYAAMLAGPPPASQSAPQDRKENRPISSAEHLPPAHGRNGSNESATSNRAGTKPATVSDPLPTFCCRSCFKYTSLHIALLVT